jgi:hypothetical protein
MSPWPVSLPGDKDGQYFLVFMILPYPDLYTLVPIFNGQKGIDWSDISSNEQLDSEIPSGSLAAVGFTVSSFKSKKDGVWNAYKSVGLNIQFAAHLI